MWIISILFCGHDNLIRSCSKALLWAMPFPISICYGNVTVFILREDVEKMFLQILTDLVFLAMPEKECFWLLCSVYEWTHQEYIITVPNSFILFQFTSLDPKEEHGHARGIKLSAEQPHCLWNFLRETAFCGHSVEKKKVRFFTLLYFGVERKWATYVQKIIFSRQILCSRD